MNDRYKKTMDSIKARDNFKKDTLLKLKEAGKEQRYQSMNKQMKWLPMAAAACIALSIGLISITLPKGNLDLTSQEINLLTRIKVDDAAIMGKQLVNIEGEIVEVSEDGLSFKLDTDQWVLVTDATEIGITVATAAEINTQYFEPTFRVGNMIAGFTENTEGDKVTAQAIYTNWNWADPIR